MKTIELERTFLAKHLPKDLENSPKKEIIDLYIPRSKHPTLRIRKNGDKFEITKKSPVENSASIQNEHTIELTKEEFETLSKVEGKVLWKIRHLYKFGKLIAEIDVFKGDLEGLIIVDFEFKNEEEMRSFVIPDFCLADVSEENFAAGGMLCGKKYSDIEKDLKKFGYVKILVKGL